MSKAQLPVIDFGPFLEGTPQGKHQVGIEMVNTMKEYGFMYIINHGIPEEDQQDAFLWAKKLFDLTLEQKMKFPHPDNPAHHRGYSSLGREKVIQMEHTESEAAALRSSPDVKESFDMGNVNHEVYCNFWPDEEDLPGFKKFCEHYFDVCDKTTKNFLRAIGDGLSLGEDYFLPYHDKSDNSLRLLHYPPVEEERLKTGEAERISAHTDYGTITLLLQDDCGGLEVEDPYNKGTFFPAPYLKGSLVVNTADCLQRWSNDTLRSTMHRVRAPPVDSETGLTKARYSIPFFVTANTDAVVEALPGTFTDENPKKYGPVTCGEWMAMRLKATY